MSEQEEVSEVIELVETAALIELYGPTFSIFLEYDQRQLTMQAEVEAELARLKAGG